MRDAARARAHGGDQGILFPLTAPEGDLKIGGGCLHDRAQIFSPIFADHKYRTALRANPS